MNATEQHNTLPYEPMNMNQPTPPQPPVQPASAGMGRPGRRHSWVGIVVTIIGAIMLIGYFAVALVSGLWQGNNKSFTEQQSAPASENVTIDVAYGDIEIAFSETATEATLDVTGRSQGGESPIALSSSGSELVLESHDGSSWFRGGPLSWEGREVEGILTLPASLEGVVDLSIEVGAGRVIVNGEVDAIDASVGAGELVMNERFETGVFSVGMGSVDLQQGGKSAEVKTDAGEANLFGEYEKLDAEVNVGELTLEGTVRDSAQILVEAGNADLTFVETMPSETRIETSVGDVDITMPNVAIELDGPRMVRERAEQSGYDIDGGASAPQVLVIVELGDVTFH